MERLVSQKCVVVAPVTATATATATATGIERANSVRERERSKGGGNYICKAAAVGFLCGVCVSYMMFFTLTTSTSLLHKDNATLWKEKEKGRRSPPQYGDRGEEDKIELLQSLWEASYHLISKNESITGDIVVPKAPHLQNCKAHVKASKQFDSGLSTWSILKGYLMEESLLAKPTNIAIPPPHPPWVEGGDEDNLPMTRHVQRDLWLHQHPSNCNDPNLRFLFTDWESNPGFGIGAQIAGMAGMLALAVNQKRILVTDYFNRADHAGCAGSEHSLWLCYFLPETSAECREHALELASQAEAWKQGVITSKQNYTTKEIWVGKTPRQWGKPWERMQPTTEIGSKLLKHHRTKDRRWWRAQEVIDQSKSYVGWDFYYTNVRRQVGNMSMPSYEASLGRETSTNYPLVNFLMAADADFFIGALGSTWCFLLDGMRSTGGKVMAGYLSVNKDRFW
ncbi:hypothetical protein KI387_005967 [Taxus chinensis]|uniref:Uncharacterized protein n=1 Tax=Taxus chinensis TaxID=29808 RepID=A0AA38LIY5_TAXCH|nr:hypothetical protein KI387_005967 [Taxus chinensis]